MLAFQSAFVGWALEVFTPVARWRAGELDDAALDALITPKIEEQRRRWDRPRILRELRATGQSIAAYVRNELRVEEPFEIMRSLKEAFRTRGFTAKKLVDVVSRSSSSNDAELDRSWLDEIDKPR